MSTYDVKIWDPRKITDTAKGRWRVRWIVAGHEKGRSFAAKPLADGFAGDLRQAIRDGTPFDEATGLPVTSAAPPQVTCGHEAEVLKPRGEVEGQAPRLLHSPLPGRVQGDAARGIRRDAGLHDSAAKAAASAYSSLSS